MAWTRQERIGLFSLIVTSLSLLVSIVAGKSVSGEWLIVFRVVPLWVWVALACALFFWMWYSCRRAQRRGGAAIGFVSGNPRERIGEKKYNGVLWRIEQEIVTDYHRRMADIFGNSREPPAVHVSSSPYCPGCRTEMEEKEIPWRFWRPYTWVCPKCKFRKTSYDSGYKVSHSVHRIVSAESGR